MRLRCTRPVAAALACAVAVGGCSWFQGLGEKVSTGFGLWDSADPSLKPAPLTAFAPTAAATVAWQADVGEAGESVFFPAFASGNVYATYRKGALETAEEYRQPATFERASALAWTQAQVQLHHLRITQDEATLPASRHLILSYSVSTAIPRPPVPADGARPEVVRLPRNGGGKGCT